MSPDTLCIIAKLQTEQATYLKARLAGDAVEPHISSRSDDGPESALAQAYLEGDEAFKKTMTELVRGLLRELEDKVAASAQKWATRIFALIAEARIRQTEPQLVSLFVRVTTTPAQNKQWRRIRGAYRASLLIELTVALRAVETQPNPIYWPRHLNDPHLAGAAFGALTAADTDLALKHLPTLLLTASQFHYEKVPLRICLATWINCRQQSGRGANPVAEILTRLAQENLHVSVNQRVINELEAMPSVKEMLASARTPVNEPDPNPKFTLEEILSRIFQLPDWLAETVHEHLNATCHWKPHPTAGMATGSQPADLRRTGTAATPPEPRATPEPIIQRVHEASFAYANLSSMGQPHSRKASTERIATQRDIVIATKASAAGRIDAKFSKRVGGIPIPKHSQSSPLRSVTIRGDRQLLHGKAV